TFSNSQSALMKKRVSQFLLGAECPLCKGKRLRKESLSVKFAGYDITELSRLPLIKLYNLLLPFSEKESLVDKREEAHPEKIIVTQRITEDIAARLKILLELGLGYLTLERS